MCSGWQCMVLRPLWAACACLGVCVLEEALLGGATSCAFVCWLCCLEKVQLQPWLAGRRTNPGH